MHRKPGKKFAQSGNTSGRALYGVDNIGAHGTVYAVEGEKDVEAARAVGAVAVCGAMGAGKAHKFDWTPLRDHPVVIVADRDEPGRRHAYQVAEQLQGIAASVRIVEARAGKDLADHIAAGLGLDDLVAVEEARNGLPVGDSGQAHGIRDAEQAKHSGQVRMAYLLAAAYENKLLHVHGIGWHQWDGRRWAADDTGAAHRAVLDVLRRALAESLGDRELRADVRKCESAAGLAGVLEIAAALTVFAATVRDLDADPYLLNTANGTLDLRTQELRPHNPADRITKVCRGAYHPRRHNQQCGRRSWRGCYPMGLYADSCSAWPGLRCWARCVNTSCPSSPAPAATGKAPCTRRCCTRWTITVTWLNRICSCTAKGRIPPARWTFWGGA
ncbi:hypothetical protein MKUB_29100 [Mycobacterium kubicae]|uniref:Bacteriophage/plasmid primase P4 C-terminal domain-containing protein n=1 Tax=Mycobacterium kubicae TaxID=120959 RepID=A0ABQ1BNZ2_9MYCO|nr:hypothetical protein MKUB_29100 [Mycobacterium kubicae]